MDQERVDLFDTPPTGKQIRLSLIMAGLLIAATIAVLLLPSRQLREVNIIVPIIDSVMIVSDLICATLLYVQASVFRSRALTVLASGFVFSALMLMTHMLTFPGAFAPGGLLWPGVNTTGWAFTIRRFALPIAVFAYVLIRRVESRQGMAHRPDADVSLGLFAAVVLAAGATLLVTAGHDLLPEMFKDRIHVVSGNLIVINLMLGAVLLVAMGTLFWQRRSVLDMWLLVVLLSWLAQLPLTAMATGRFTLMFYAQWAVMPLANLVLLIALLAALSRLYSRLALSLAAHSRERDARLMTLDAVASSIAHELGQSLTAISLSANGCNELLSKQPPDWPKTLEASKATVDAADNTFNVIKSIRATYRKRPVDVSLNELANAVARSLGRETMATQVSLEMMLEDPLPTVVADRVQLQRVMLNLFTNAIEALREIRGRPRRMTIRTVAVQDKKVLLQVCDNGPGIADENMSRIFETYFTTKGTGTGLGLSLCRMIVEDHGGRLWASNNERHGVTFNLELPFAG